MNKKDLVRIGRKLSYILRHTDKLIDSNGWALVVDVLKELNIRRDILFLIVETNDKQRYEYNENGSKIRARQGHSVDVDVELDERIPDVELYHGTSSFFIDSILKDGIQSKNRKHVHLTSNRESALKSGKRHGGDPKLVVIDCDAMIKDGIIFFCSRNDVWLTEYVHPKYIKFII